MFEILGLLISFAVCMFLALLASAIVGVIVWLVSKRMRIAITASAIALPPLCVIYLFICGAVLPNESLFGDISQPLPNGYYLRALGKMPDFAGIGRGPDSSSPEVPLTECVGSLGVYGSIVVGRYSHPCATFDPHPNEAYFMFDTETAAHHDFQTSAALEASIGHPVALREVLLFQSREPAYLHQRHINGFICFGPMALAFAILALFVLISRHHSIKAATYIEHD